GLAVRDAVTNDLEKAARWRAERLCLCSSSPLPPSPPAEKATTRRDQPRQTSPGDGGGNIYRAKQSVHLAVDTIGEEKGVGAPVVAPGPEAEGPKAAWRIRDAIIEANVNRDREQEIPARVEDVDLAVQKTEIADQQIAAGRTETGRGESKAPR